MTKDPKKQPTELGEDALDDAKGGIGLLHDAGIGLLQPTDQIGQKVVPTDQKPASHSGGANFQFGDGSVR